MTEQIKNEGIAAIRSLAIMLGVQPEWLEIVAEPRPRGYTFHVYAGPKGTGILVGRSGHNARALRVLVTAVAKRLNAVFDLEIEDGSPEWKK